MLTRKHAVGYLNNYLFIRETLQQSFETYNSLEFH